MARVAAALLLILLVSCGPQSLKDVRKEGRSTLKALTTELKEVRSGADLQKHHASLSARFDKLADLMIAGWELYRSDAKQVRQEFEEIDHELSAELEAEMARIGSFDEKLLESCYKEAQTKLHAYLHKHEK